MICKRLSGPWIPPPAFGRPKVQSVGNFLPAILCPIFSPLPPKKAYQEQTGKSGSFGVWHQPQGYVSNFLVRPASS